MYRRLTVPAMILAVLLAWTTGCLESTGPGWTPDPLPGLIVSAPVRGLVGAARGGDRAASSSAVNAGVVYVSLPPGSVPDGLQATIRNVVTSQAVTVSVLNGGFDPVPLAASVGDTLVVELARTGSAALIRAVQLVRANRPVVVVRTVPPPGQVDVPLNSTMVIVFGEPVDPATVNPGSVRLLRDTTPVAGTVRFSDATQIRVEFHPADLLATQTQYRLVATQAIRDVNGVALESPLSVPFTTGTVGTASGLVFAAVSTAAGYTCGLTRGGAAYCWGMNDAGRLGTGTLALSLNTTPAPVSGGLVFATVSTGHVHSCGVTTGGAAYCWGTNVYGRLGIDSTAWRTCPPTPGWARPQSCPTPMAVAGGLMFKAVSAGGFHTCGVTTDGAAYCWGLGLDGELGAGTPPVSCTPAGYASFDCMTPVAVAGGLTFATVSAGGWAHTCGVTTSGTAYCWGDNSSGELGTGTTTGPQQCVYKAFYSCSYIPVAVAGGLTFKAVSAGSYHTCGVTTDGAAYCWGDNSYGELGTGTTTPSSTPVAVAGGLTFATVSAGGAQACGVTTSGATYCWGSGRGPIPSAAPVVVLGAPTFAAVSAGEDNDGLDGVHSCGVTPVGVAYCWGANRVGQLGDGTQTSTAAPVKVAGQP
jgi:hypothetical protein